MNQIDGLHPNARGSDEVTVLSDWGNCFYRALPKHIHIKPNEPTQDYANKVLLSPFHRCYDGTTRPMFNEVLFPSKGFWCEVCDKKTIAPEVQPEECYRCGSSPCKCGDEVQPTEVTRLAEAKNVLAIQGDNGNWNLDPYMHGMYNGMELIVAIFEDREPEYKKAPDKWIDNPTPTKAELANRERKAAVEALNKLRDSYEFNLPLDIDIDDLIAEYERGEANE